METTKEIVAKAVVAAGSTEGAAKKLFAEGRYATYCAARAAVRYHRGERIVNGRTTPNPVMPQTTQARAAAQLKGTASQGLEKDRLLSRIRTLESELSDKRKETVALAESVDWIKDVQAREVTPPDWATELLPKHKGHRSVGIPMTLWSDWHWGEVVDPVQIHGANTFNVEIAQQRCKRLVDRTILLCKHYVNSDYPGIVVLIAGDMLSGDIHEELTMTNELSTMQALLDLQAHATAALATLADAFKRVWVTVVIGNHTRTTLKPRAKGAAYTSYDWMLGQQLKQAFAKDPRVTINVSSALDEQVKVANMTFNLTHGDQFRGGSGIQGAFAPWFIGDYRKHKRQRTLHADYDYLVMGHWHQAAMVGGMIVNSSLKGYDEYAYRNNFPFEKPQQWLWIAHPEKGIVYRIPILVGEGD